MQPEQHRSADTEALEARLRALPLPPVPHDLESRLLGRIPSATPARKPWRAAWVGVAAAVVIVCLLVIVARISRDNRRPDVASGNITRHPNLSAGRDVDDVAVAPFRWPLDETSPMSAATPISAELLN